MRETQTDSGMWSAGLQTDVSTWEGTMVQLNPEESRPIARRTMAPADFDSRKQAVLAGLRSDAADKSPKGHVDAPVRRASFPSAATRNRLQPRWAPACGTRWSHRDARTLRRASRAIVGLALGVMMQRMPPVAAEALRADGDKRRWWICASVSTRTPTTVPPAPAPAVSGGNARNPNTNPCSAMHAVQQPGREAVGCML
jgi:hypothetical protein